MSLTTHELEALWSAVFGEPPPVSGDAALMAELIVRFLPPAPAYGDPAVNIGGESD